MLKKNLFYNSLLSVSQFIFPLITFPYVSRILGPKGIGSVNFIDSFTQYFILFSALGIPIYGVREIAKVKNDKNALGKVFNEIFCIHLISTLAFSIIYLIAGLVIPDLKGHFDLILVGIVIMFFCVFAVGWFFQGLEVFSYIAIRTLIVRCASIFILFIFLKSDSSALVYYCILASGFVLNGMSNIYFLNKHVKVQFTGLELKKHLKPLIIILGSSLAVSVYILMDNIILGFMKGDEAVGLYSTALRIVRIPFAIFGAISAVMIPQISQAYHKQDLQKIQSLIHKSFSFVCVAGIPVSMGVFVSASFLINFFAGIKFHEAITALQVLSPVILLVGLNNLFALQLLAPMGKDKLLFRSVLIGMLFSLASNFCLIPLLAHIGTAITNMLTECVVTVAAYFFVNRYIKVEVDLKIFLQCLLGAIVFLPVSYVIRLLNVDYTIQEILVIIACVLFYIIYLWFFIHNIYIETMKRSLLVKLKLKPLYQ